MSGKIRSFGKNIRRAIKAHADLPLHPFGLALFPVLSLYASNIREVFLSSTLLPSTVILSATVLLLAALNIVVKNLQKTAVQVSFLLLLFFSYGHVVNLLKDLNFKVLGFALFQDLAVFYVWVVLFFSGSFLILRSGKNFKTTTVLLNTLALLLIITPLVNIAYFGLTTRRIALSQSAITKEVSEDFKKVGNPKSKPDIYYIILDRYANTQVLKNTFAFDNSGFIDFLENKGFYIAENSFANYPKTFLSLASSLNMSYLDFLTQQYKDSRDWAVVYPYLYDYKVWRFLKAQGYTFFHFGDWWDPTRINRFADRNINYYGTGITDEFANKLLETTFLYPFIKRNNTWYERVRAGHLYQFEQLSNLSKEKGPKFIFTHLIMPHEPYVFGKDCEPQDEKIKLGSKKAKPAYLNQLLCTNKKVTALIDQIIAASDPAPIIILQSDEGPFTEEFEGGVGGNIDWKKLKPATLKDHLRIMNAYFLPESAKNILYPSITPVNSFRVIFNAYFDTDFPILPDKSYIFPDMDRPYVFIDVTSQLRGN